MRVPPTVIRYMRIENIQTALCDAGQCVRMEAHPWRLNIFLMNERCARIFSGS